MFVIAAMMACFGSVAHAPLAVMIMVAEMTGSFAVIPGAMVAVGVAYLIIYRSNVSIYRAQRLNRETAAAERVTVRPRRSSQPPTTTSPTPDRKAATMPKNPSLHAVSLTKGEIVEESDLGSIRRVTADNFPILRGLSIDRVVINPGAMRTPHWHANANELTYCVSGTALVSVLDTYGQFSSFVVTAGDMSHIDSGSLHHIENIGEDVAEFIIAFRSERPEAFGLFAAFGAMTDAVLGNTYDLDSSDFTNIRRSTADRLLARHRRSGGTVDGVLRRPTQVLAGGAEPPDQRGGRVGTPCTRAVLARIEGPVDVFAANPRGRHARAALAPDHRRDGLRARRLGADDRHGARRHARHLVPQRGRRLLIPRRTRAASKWWTARAGTS